MGQSAGNVAGPGSSTDHAIVAFNGTTGKVIQNSGATVSDAGGITAVGVAAVQDATLVRELLFTSSTTTGSLRNVKLSGGDSIGIILPDPPSGTTEALLPPKSGTLIVDTSGSGAPATSQAAGTLGEFRRISTTCYYCFATGTGASDRWAKWTVTTSF